MYCRGPLLTLAPTRMGFGGVSECGIINMGILFGKSGRKGTGTASDRDRPTLLLSACYCVSFWTCLSLSPTLSPSLCLTLGLSFSVWPTYNYGWIISKSPRCSITGCVWGLNGSYQITQMDTTLSNKDRGTIVNFKIDYLIYSVNEVAIERTSYSWPDLTSKTSYCNSTKCHNRNRQCTISVTTSYDRRVIIILRALETLLFPQQEQHTGPFAFAPLPPEDYNPIPNLWPCLMQ